MVRGCKSEWLHPSVDLLLRRPVQDGDIASDPFDIFCTFHIKTSEWLISQVIGYCKIIDQSSALGENAKKEAQRPLSVI